MRWQLILALLVSVLLHAALLLLPGAEQQGRQPRQGAFSVRLRGAPSQMSLTADKTGQAPPPEQAAAKPEPSPLDASPAAEVVLEPSLPRNIAAFGPSQDEHWYTASEVAIRAQTLSNVDLPDPPGFQGEIASGRLVLDIYIDEFGVTDHVDMLLVSPPGRFDETAIQPFLAARWSPAVRDGRYVKSVKQVELCVGVCGDTTFTYNGGVMTGGDGR